MAGIQREERSVIRCDGCSLNQFETQSGRCRRCRRHLPIEKGKWLEQSLAENQAKKKEPHQLADIKNPEYEAAIIPGRKIRRPYGVPTNSPNLIGEERAPQGRIPKEYRSFGKWLHIISIVRGLTRDETGKLLGVSPQHVSRWIWLRSIPSGRTFIKICNKLCVIPALFSIVPSKSEINNEILVHAASVRQTERLLLLEIAKEKVAGR